MIPILRKFGEIRGDLSAVLSGTHNHVQLGNVVGLCHALAIASVRSRVRAGTLSETFLGLRSGDIATECITDLFLPACDGTFPRLKAYFGGIDLESISDEELLAHFRRLVFSKVGDGIFRIYGEVDPQLARIIRNIKFAVSRNHNFEEVEIVGERCICPAFVDKLRELPSIDMESLKMEVGSKLHGRERVPELMSRLSKYLRKQDQYSRVVPIVVVAQAFRLLFNEPLCAEAHGSPEDDLLLEDAEVVIRDACHDVRSHMERRYVKGKKIQARFIEYYFRVIEDSLVEKLWSNDGTSESLFASLAVFLPDLTRDEYKKTHKKVLEYLLKLSTDRAKEELARMYKLCLGPDMVKQADTFSAAHRKRNDEI